MIASELQNSIAPAAAVLKAMANPQRLRILCLLAEGELSVSQIESRVALSQSALSQHLAKLRQQKLVRTRRDRQTIHYALEGHAARTILAALVELQRTLPAAANTDERDGKRVSA
ncbi:MAG TPA: metalloregulator ArsR/SmtB family transcription factor [Aliidongia sp.]|uniref:ArsR/SmtB family transcription factor n=1 Tax=Aliidongia sp. TaxID=1914230 RepID=UPI002DDCC2A6|nr:metalloregulator ArsR/SmtB family transcription factor [Aliidongia sp.]HEV2674816.1 metalloregulator ArsR/SmtB family transcription factor [Aliidongia sp.]